MSGDTVWVAIRCDGVGQANIEGAWSSLDLAMGALVDAFASFDDKGETDASRVISLHDWKWQSEHLAFVTKIGDEKRIVIWLKEMVVDHRV